MTNLHISERTMYWSRKAISTWEAAHCPRSTTDKTTWVRFLKPKILATVLVTEISSLGWRALMSCGKGFTTNRHRFCSGVLNLDVLSDFEAVARSVWFSRVFFAAASGFNEEWAVSPGDRTGKISTTSPACMPVSPNDDGLSKISSRENISSWTQSVHWRRVKLVDSRMVRSSGVGPCSRWGTSSEWAVDSVSKLAALTCLRCERRIGPRRDILFHRLCIAKGKTASLQLDSTGVDLEMQRADKMSRESSRGITAAWLWHLRQHFGFPVLRSSLRICIFAMYDNELWIIYQFLVI